MNFMKMPMTFKFIFISHFLASSGTLPDMENFDLSLMIGILWTFNEEKKLEPPLDDQTKDDLEFVRLKRNEIVHGSSTERSDDFTVYVLDKLTLVSCLVRIVIISGVMHTSLITK